MVGDENGEGDAADAMCFSLVVAKVAPPSTIPVAHAVSATSRLAFSDFVPNSYIQCSSCC
jgi:hypothetical protein